MSPPTTVPLLGNDCADYDEDATHRTANGQRSGVFQNALATILCGYLLLGSGTCLSYTAATLAESVGIVAPPGLSTPSPVRLLQIETVMETVLFYLLRTRMAHHPQQQLSSLLAALLVASILCGGAFFAILRYTQSGSPFQCVVGAADITLGLLIYGTAASLVFGGKRLDTFAERGTIERQRHEPFAIELV